MKVLNIHERTLHVPPALAGTLIDSLSSNDDRLWPHDSWPPMRFDRPLGIGATGGHGPVRYRIESYERGLHLRFQFLAPRGFHGFHAYELVPDERGVRLRHVLEMHARGTALITWPLVFRPLHDALIEDSLARAEASLGLSPTVRPWSWRTKILRWLMSGGRVRKQVRPVPTSNPEASHPAEKAEPSWLPSTGNDN